MSGSILDAHVALPGGESAAPAGGRELAFTMQSQAQSEWCWAAVSVSVAAFYEPATRWTQCALVNDQFGLTSCCAEGSGAACNQPYYLTNGLQAVGHLGRNFAQRLPLDGVAGEIDAGRPLGVCIDWTGGGGHVVALDGYDLAGGMLDVEDSMFGHSYLPYESFPAQYQGGGTWSWTYLTCP